MTNKNSYVKLNEDVIYEIDGLVYSLKKGSVYEVISKYHMFGKEEVQLVLDVDLGFNITVSEELTTKFKNYNHDSKTYLIFRLLRDNDVKLNTDVRSALEVIDNEIGENKLVIDSIITLLTEVANSNYQLGASRQKQASFENIKLLLGED
jgi:hypothetical protein